MTPDQQIRLEALKLAIPQGLMNPDAALIIERAKAFERYVSGEGQAAKAPSQQPAPIAQKPGHSGHNQPRHR